MHPSVAIENINEIRQNEGIDDVELRLAIRGLKAGGFVRLTLLGKASAETLPVRITSIRGSAFRGKLARRPTCSALLDLPADTILTFTANHIHSVVKENGPEDS